jgi:hypothetical protein
LENTTKEQAKLVIKGHLLITNIATILYIILYIYIFITNGVFAMFFQFWHGIIPFLFCLLQIPLMIALINKLVVVGSVKLPDIDIGYKSEIINYTKLLYCFKSRISILIIAIIFLFKLSMFYLIIAICLSFITIVIDKYPVLNNSVMKVLNEQFDYL